MHSLSHAIEVDTSLARMEERSRHVQINDESLCDSCHARLGTKLFAMYPDDTIVCYKVCILCVFFLIDFSFHFLYNCRDSHRCFFLCSVTDGKESRHLWQVEILSKIQYWNQAGLLHDDIANYVTTEFKWSRSLPLARYYTYICNEVILPSAAMSRYIYGLFALQLLHCCSGVATIYIGR